MHGRRGHAAAYVVTAATADSWRMGAPLLARLRT
jgi:hypothetical protein